MASPYNPGLRNATALGLAMGAEAAGVTAGIVNALLLGAEGNPTGSINALRLGNAISTTSTAFAGGTVTKVTSETTLVITHGLAGTPTFIMTTPILKPDDSAVAPVTNSTSVTFTRTTATSNWSYSFILGFTA